ncbi:hypothetical protein HF086_012878 [Spodoptera exigua]|uniref:V-type proton ATPase subunit a n=1 Tax=Spodoptera exigua TaxID=7107 RepID=A0A922SMW3_SPOEX|nr:hypothetical protein HF086_012878 [Spodoptera exigua]
MDYFIIFQGHELQKTVFVVFFHGEQIKLRVKKVCHGFKATLYPCPATYKDQLDMLAGVGTRIKDLEMVLEQTENHRRLVLTNIARDISTWMVAVRKEKAIYHTLNMFSMDIVKKCLIAESLYTIITFPFLFAVMFGDVGHGIIMTAFAAILVIYEKRFLKIKTDNEIWNIFFGGRYIILLMGIFSIYTGLIYNDMFSKSLNIFGTSWRNVYEDGVLRNHTMLELDPKTAYTQTPYPFGLDPAWQFASNNIIFLNSFKMKLSIIFGVIHMAFGVTMSVVNFNFFRKPEMIFLQYIPQILFLLLLFWYLCLLMFMKWIMYSAVSEDPSLGTSCAPSVLIIFINMMLMKSSEDKPPCRAMMYAGQNEQYQQGVETGEVTEKEGHDGGLAEELITQCIHTIEYVLGAVSHTASYLRLWALSLAHAQKPLLPSYCPKLSTPNNISPSFPSPELSAVLWQRVLVMGMGPPGVTSIKLYIIFAVWAFFTLAILVLMEGLSAFLHTLRLHWVEFMSKFYEGQGYAFAPFCFTDILENEEDDHKPVMETNGGPPE